MSEKTGEKKTHGEKKDVSGKKIGLVSVVDKVNCGKIRVRDGVEEYLTVYKDKIQWVHPNQITPQLEYYISIGLIKIVRQKQ